jgi:hypothetical protein
MTECLFWLVKQIVSVIYSHLILKRCVRYGFRPRKRQKTEEKEEEEIMA